MPNKIINYFFKNGCFCCREKKKKKKKLKAGGEDNLSDLQPIGLPALDKTPGKLKLNVDFIVIIMLIIYWCDVWL